MSSLKEITEKLAAKGKLISKIYEEAGEDLDFSKVKSLEGDTTAKLEVLRALDVEVTALATQRKDLIKLEEGRGRAYSLNEELNKPAQGMTFPGKGDTRVDQKSLGELFTESKAYKDKGQTAAIDIDTKTIMSALVAHAEGWPPEIRRIPRVELTAQQTIKVVDVFPILSTNQSAIKYVYESTFTNNAAEVAENTQSTTATYGEAALKLTETSVPVQKVAVWLPVTDEQLEDVEGIQDYINSRLTYMLRAQLDSQLVSGNGTAPNLRGVANASGVQTQPKGSDPTPDAIYKAMTAVRVTGFAEPDVVLLHPNDWQAIRLLTTADGIYIFGSPQEVGTPRIWGLPAVISTFVTENTGIVGDFRGYAALYLKRGIEFKVTDSHASLFISGTQAIRADMRCAAVYFRGTAFCKVTSI